MAGGSFTQAVLRNLPFQPTADQARLFEALEAFGADHTSDIMVVAGYAGTGKTSAIAAFVKALEQHKYKYVLLAPTGRAAKVLSGFTGLPAFTIHKHIYRQKSMSGGFGKFTLDMNRSRNTFFIIDESSLITIGGDGGGNVFGSGDLLQDLVDYVRSAPGNKMIFVGDRGQLPPVGMDASPALDIDFMQSAFGPVHSADLGEVLRQAQESGILHNATLLRKMESAGETAFPQLELEGFDDISRISGGELIESMSDAIGKYGLDGVVVLTRSNKRANRYNMGIRSQVLYREEQLTRSDKLMVVKNCYQFLEKLDDEDFFIANGDMARLVKVSKYEERYGLHFAQATLAFPDYDNLEITAKIILDTLTSEAAALTAEQQQALFDGVWADYDDIPTKKKRYEAVREDKYFNALQIKYATAITCHKSQGGGWPCVYIDNPFWGEEVTLDDIKWLYTAITRSSEKVFLVNFPDNCFKR
ncbi:MAG: AAA family ATPase [Bacteroidales bacterium]|nr:AAA family ATPase [Bacteroidales bacterium]